MTSIDQNLNILQIHLDRMEVYDKIENGNGECFKTEENPKTGLR